MESLNKRADQADDLIKKLVERVNSLEKNKSAGVVGVGIHTEVKQKIRSEIVSLRTELQKAHDENKALKAENQKLNKSAKAGGASSEYKKKNDANWDKAMAKAQNLRKHVSGLEEENKALKAEIATLNSSGGQTMIKTDKLTQEQLDWLKNAMHKVRADMVQYMEKGGNSSEAAKPVASAAATGLEQMTLETIQDLKYYIITTDLDQLRKEREECELGELDDDDLKLYLGRKVRVIEIEEDDDSANVRFDSHDTQWFPVTCLYKGVAVAVAAAPAPAKKEEAAAPSGSHLVQMTMETYQDLKMYFVTDNLEYLKKQWYAAELGELDDEDFMIYLGREVKSLEVDEDDETVNTRFDNHDTQHFPVTCLYKKVEGAAPAAKAEEPGMERMSLETLVERKQYFVTKDLVELKKYWYEADLGELDDEDFMIYLGREVKAIDTEEDDETINVRFDNHDTQWFPVQVLFRKAAAAPASVNGNLKKQNMDTIKERKTYFVTKDIKELKKEWYEAELGELDDEDFEKYLGREVKTIDIEEDDETVNVRFDNHDSQWFPVTTLYL